MSKHQCQLPAPRDAKGHLAVVACQDANCGREWLSDWVGGFHWVPWEHPDPDPAEQPPGLRVVR